MEGGTPQGCGVERGAGGHVQDAALVAVRHATGVAGDAEHGRAATGAAPTDPPALPTALCRRTLRCALMPTAIVIARDSATIRRRPVITTEEERLISDSIEPDGLIVVALGTLEPQRRLIPAITLSRRVRRVRIN